MDKTTISLFDKQPEWTIPFNEIIRDKFELFLFTTFRSNKNRYVHNWYPYLQGFSSALVEYLLRYFKATTDSIVLDPWTGVGTTNVVCNLLNIQSYGIDISPLAVFISKVKCSILPIEDEILKLLLRLKIQVAEEEQDINFSSINQFVIKALPPQILRDAYNLRKHILRIENEKNRDFLLFALISSLNNLSHIQKDGAHYRFRSSTIASDVWQTFEYQVYKMLKYESLEDIKLYTVKNTLNLAEIMMGDSRKLPLDDCSIDFVITSPPYLNRDNYIAQNKLELLFGDFVKSYKGYRDLTFNTLRSHVEAKPLHFNKSTNYVFINHYIHELLSRKHLLNNNKVIEMIEGYFVDMDLSFQELSRVVKPGGQIAIVVSNSSWAGVHIEVDKILSEIGALHGLIAREIWVTRFKLNSAQQIVKYGKTFIRESIIIFNKID